MAISTVVTSHFLL